MPEVQEVFRMATEKVMPDPDAMERQHGERRRRTTRRKAGVYGLVAALAIGAAVRRSECRPRGRTPYAEHQALAGGSGDRFGPLLPRPPNGREDTAGGELRRRQQLRGVPDRTRLAYGTSRGGGCGGSDVTTIANIDGTDVRTLESPEGLTICGARWSPDGTKLVYQERDGTSSDDVGNLFVEDLSSGRRTQLTDLDLSSAWWYFLSPSFSHDGRNVIFHLPRSSSQTTKFDVWSVPVTGGEPTLMLRNASFPMDRLDGPEGVQIAFLSPMTDDFAVVVDIPTGESSTGG